MILRFLKGLKVRLLQLANIMRDGAGFKQNLETSKSVKNDFVLTLESVRWAYIRVLKATRKPTIRQAAR